MSDKRNPRYAKDFDPNSLVVLKCEWSSLYEKYRERGLEIARLEREARFADGEIRTVHTNLLHMTQLVEKLKESSRHLHQMQRQ